MKQTNKQKITRHHTSIFQNMYRTTQKTIFFKRRTKQNGGMEMGPVYIKKVFRVGDDCEMFVGTFAKNYCKTCETFEFNKY